MPADRTFVDINSLVYADDITAEEKNAIASDIVTNLWHSGLGVVSIQNPFDLIH